MYKHILVPTDGSRLAGKGIKEGVALAKALGAKITAVYVTAPFVPRVYSEGAAIYAPGFTAGDYKRLVEKEAKKALAAVERAARAAGVRCDTRFVTGRQPWQGVLRVARARRCDAIVMASHGRGAVAGLILGSETSHVLARSTIPVLVVR
jgi:nucleotide-binding universal stress UspA family protein